MKTALVIDSGSGNLFSLRAALQRLGCEVTLSQTPNSKEYDFTVLPGQGRYRRVLAQLRAAGWESYLNRQIAQGKPVLGICVGMQIMFESSDEDPQVAGLGWFSGSVRALDFPKTPMVGWAPLESQCWAEDPVYFVNSYAVKTSPYQVASCQYGERFCAAVQKDNIAAVQFHPEKSAKAGEAILNQLLAGWGLAS